MINRVELEIQTSIHTPIDTWFLIKNPEIYNAKKKASSTNGAGLTVSWYVVECK